MLKRAAFDLMAFSVLASTAQAGDPAIRTILFDSLDASPSVFTTAGFKYAPDGVGRDGFVALASIGAGVRAERIPSTGGHAAPTFVRTTLSSAALTGYQFFADWGVLSLFAGPEVVLDTLATRGVLFVLPAQIGLRLQGELWAHPFDETLVTATAIFGSIRWERYLRGSWGYRILGAYIGPELAHYADVTGYRKWSIGLHATDFAIGPLSLRVSAGLVHESETRRSAPYFSLTGWISL